ncbi:glycoside hydrolase family 38 N-terminal domain-containing protein [Qingrenia yutianensis]|uniref:Glycoside hydrolase family 57 n=1 Tax=Qingrenia yutianensis TaxID=2763676 RepID=A0A926FAK4_9FIRM|nr:glycoside hydrolase family 57 [Qingrenia yutianensis]MBC8597368.1 glycoside hydrolase family 57 [Qingrenia yutianensis]
MSKIIFMPHANIQYSQLAPERRYWVMKNCYEKLFDLVAGGDYKIAFEASGITIEEMAKQAPEVLEKLKNLVAEGKVEPVSSPYIHFMLANIQKEVCLHSLKHSLDVWEKYVGKRPVIGWNPECGWASYIPDIYKEAGMEALVMDADSLMLSFDEIRQATGLQFDVAGHSNKNHLFKIEEYIKDKPDFLKFITNPSVAPNGLKMIFRSDCMANLLLWYLMGATEGLREEPINMNEIKNMFKNWQDRINETGSFIMPYAEDAEYIGSSAYFYVKQFNQARFFEEEPNSVARFKEILDAAKESGYEFALPSEVLAEGNLLENPYVDNIENGVAWHGGTAKAWANTEYSRIMDPVCMSILNGIKAVAEKLGETLDTLDMDLNNAMMALASAWVSDSRWPPDPTSPGRFNVRESLDDMYKANNAIKTAMEKGGIAEKRGLYSPNLMETQIKAIDKKLMDIKYFGEE